MQFLPLNIRTSLGAACLAAGAIVGSAQAADWQGPYAGLYYGIHLGGFGSDVVGAQLGHNWDTGTMVYGVELDAAKATSGSGTQIAAHGRIGVEASNNVLLFGLLGIGNVNPGGTYGVAGIGGEVALGTNVSLRGEVDYLKQFGGPSATMAKLGVAFRF